MGKPKKHTRKRVPTKTIAFPSPENAADIILHYAKDKRFQRATGPTLLHFYLSLDKTAEGSAQLKKVILACVSRRMKTEIDGFGNEGFYEKVPAIIEEIKTDCLEDSPVLYLYGIMAYHQIDTPNIRLGVRYAIPPLEARMETEEGVEYVLHKFGINHLLKKFGRLMQVMPAIGEHIKYWHPEIKDKVQLWETLHGVGR